MTDMLLEDHRLADGTRPLVIGRSVPFLSIERLHPTADSVACFTVALSAGNNDQPPAHCQRRIQPGRWYLQQLERDGDDVETGRVFAYCAPCAIRDAAAWDVREVRP
ncbi:MAG: hypothetical protein JO222_01405 [Frankiales bacterium]|nr:hypothetical protein [Frankiales bacterium]